MNGMGNQSINITPTINHKAAQNAAKQAVASAQGIANKNKVSLDFDVNKQKLVNQIKILGRDNDRLFGSQEMAEKYNQLLDSANIVNNAKDLKSLRGQLTAFKTELNATNNAGKTWGSSLKDSIQSFTKLFSGASFLYAAVNQTKTAATEAKNLDDRLVDLQKVTDEIADRDALYKYFDKAMDKAKELKCKSRFLVVCHHRVQKDGLELWKMQSWAASGQRFWKMLETWILILPLVLSRHLLLPLRRSAAMAMTRWIKSWKPIPIWLMKCPISTALTRRDWQKQFEYRQEPLLRHILPSNKRQPCLLQPTDTIMIANYLGNTAKIGSLRLRASEDADAKTELQQLGEDIDDVAQSASKLREKLLKLTNVDIMEADGKTFKSFYDQLYEISQVMDQLSDVDRANVLETIFGKSRAAGGAALLSGMKGKCRSI